MLSLYLASSSVLKKMDIYRKRLLWYEGSNNKKISIERDNAAAPLVAASDSDPGRPQRPSPSSCLKLGIPTKAISFFFLLLLWWNERSNFQDDKCAGELLYNFFSFSFFFRACWFYWPWSARRGSPTASLRRPARRTPYRAPPPPRPSASPSGPPLAHPPPPPSAAGASRERCSSSRVWQGKKMEG